MSLGYYLLRIVSREKGRGGEKFLLPLPQRQLRPSEVFDDARRSPRIKGFDVSLGTHTFECRNAEVVMVMGGGFGRHYESKTLRYSSGPALTRAVLIFSISITTARFYLRVVSCAYHRVYVAEVAVLTTHDNDLLTKGPTVCNMLPRSMLLGKTRHLPIQDRLVHNAECAQNLRFHNCAHTRRDWRYFQCL